jgi:molybdate transport system regulatory protein
MKGRIIEIETEGLISKIKISIEPAIITAIITKEAADAMDIKNNDSVVAVVKATEVMIGKEE